ncbi:MAG TPA: hypothetical protein EYQ46_00255 [Myxococcales bacterium]|nr:hypothetical protein [Myxococcales bacterium]
MAGNGGQNRNAVAAIAAVAVVGLGAMFWTRDSGESPNRETPRPGSSGSTSPADEMTNASPSPPSMAAGAAPALKPVTLVQSKFAIEEHGRLKIDADSLPESGDVTVALAMPDDVRGTGPMPVQIIGVDGRKIEIQANPLPGQGAGLELAVDVDWLKRGRYMVQVRTKEKTPLALRRFVLEVD